MSPIQKNCKARKKQTIEYIFWEIYRFRYQELKIVLPVNAFGLENFKNEHEKDKNEN